MDRPLTFHHFYSQCSIGEKTRTEKSVKMIIFLIWTTLCFFAMQLERAGSGSAATTGNLKHPFSGLMVSMFEYAPTCTLKYLGVTSSTLRMHTDTAKFGIAWTAHTNIESALNHPHKVASCEIMYDTEVTHSHPC